MDDSNYLVRPRLNDYYGIFLNQAKVDFAIPYLNEDIPLYVDPFRLWQSPSYQDNGLHILFQNAFNCLGKMYLEGQQEKAVELLKRISECNEVGLGNSKSRNGRKIGDGIAIDILRLYETIPSINKYGLKHPEVIQMLVNGISKDRINDIASNMLGSFLIDYTIQECRQYGIPTEKCEIEYLDVKNMDMKKESCELPVNPNSKQVLWFVPKRWLRKTMWLNDDDYLNHYLVNRIEYLLPNRKF